VVLNVADSHKRCIGLLDAIERDHIELEDHVFVGSHVFIGGGTVIGHHSVIGAHTALRGQRIPPYSLVYGNPPIVRAGYYRRDRGAEKTIRHDDMLYDVRSFQRSGQ
jgi:acetyltransferase-like isoleucine patch superfamily enzyme